MLMLRLSTGAIPSSSSPSGGGVSVGAGSSEVPRPVRVILAGPSLARGRHLLPPFRDRTARLAVCQPYGQRYRACKA